MIMPSVRTLSGTTISARRLMKTLPALARAPTHQTGRKTHARAQRGVSPFAEPLLHTSGLKGPPTEGRSASSRFGFGRSASSRFGLDGSGESTCTRP